MYETKKIIVIDNNLVNRNFILDYLHSQGYNAIGAENGITGLQLTRKYLPDLVICDLVMPDMDGYSILSHLREDSLTAITPFIFLTAINTKASLRKAMELGADDYLTKPVTTDELLRAINIRLQKQDIFRYWYATNPNQLASTELPNTSVNSSSIFPDIPHLKRIFDYIEANYQEGITSSDVAEAVGYSSAYLTNQVGKQTGKPINVWIVKRRMVAALSLLENTNQTIEEIAVKIGYQNAPHFSRQFRQHYGLSPANWRKKHQLNPDSTKTKLQFRQNRSGLVNSVPAGRN
ncbi:MAG: DNA-binding response regulator [Aphanizomenon gracile PMC649.10]|jgi:YesN/AraC family two-component response regulator|nr:DNA-binding response regulator [Aphanizomenon gracile PMC638.10]MDM3850468.1 DNA-binding response regulator [Aphanizomenon gracile PMC627.10]MDM3854124.1 DNA-binding response regulator [Aphanizomenon gracile PMC649.10]MDM3862757.1 DNA-binding response regulator [Aphanizomenon gracile PMC644.10]